jgi:hypothetical protein
MHPVLQAAIDESVAAFGADRVLFSERPDGSVRVTVRGIHVGDAWSPPVTDLTTTLLVSFPATQPYPFYLPANLNRINGKPMPSNLQKVTVDGQVTLQLSVRPQGSRPVESFPALIAGVASWMKTH